MAKTKKKREKKKPGQQGPAITFNLRLSSFQKRIIPYIILLLAAGLGVYYIINAYNVNKEHCFPLDDPWIHLTFARNLVEYGSFSYFKNEMVTAGSTSPIYTLLLAAGYIFTKNEYFLSFFLGIASFAFSALVIYKLSVSVLAENWLAIAAALIFALDRWMNFFAASGMETPLYIFLLLSAYYCYIKRNALLFGFLLALTIWARPDAIAFVFAVAIDYFILVYFSKKNPELNKDYGLFNNKELIKIGIIFSVVMLLYFAMNMALSGTLLPNTFSAKTAYYSVEFRSRANFLKFEVWGYFTSSSYSLLIVPFIIGALKLIYNIFKSKHNPLIAALMFIFFLVFLYWYKLPFAAVKGRYLVPIIPFYILISVYGTREFYKYIAVYIKDKKIVNSLTIIFFTIIIIYSGIAYAGYKDEYAEQTHHISIRNLAAAKWINENTPENSVIATHDIGAIGYYTRRRIVDVAGLVSPQFTQRLFDPNFSKFMVEEMKRENVSYIAFIKEWYQVVNQNPLFLGGDNNTEIMAIYKFDAEKTHILSRDVNGAIINVLELIGTRQVQQPKQIQQVMSKVVAADPQSSYSYFLLANTLMFTKDAVNAEKNLKKALEIFPGFREANLMLADLYTKQNRTNDAKEQLNGYLKSNPTDTSAIRMLNTITDTTKTKLK
jgi:hypothetical protein